MLRATSFLTIAVLNVIVTGNVQSDESQNSSPNVTDTSEIEPALLLADSVAEEPAIQQVQFGGFGSQFFGRPSVAAATPGAAASGASSQSQVRRLTARAPATPRRQRLARAPDMIGDSLQTPMQLTVISQNATNNLFVHSQVVTAGGNARSKISDHNKALPVDRIYFNYNHFHNAVQRQVFNGFGDVVQQSTHMDRFTMGAERTILNGDGSVELRLPLSKYPDLDTTLPGGGPAGRFKSSSGTVGNLSLIGKHLLINDQDLVVSCGMGLEFPTGADGSTLAGTTRFNVKNESLFLQPFAAMTLDNGEVFFHSFLQVDVDVTGSPLVVSDEMTPGSAVGVGEFNSQTLLHWDTTAGIWLARSDEQSGLTGVAAILEYHLTNATSSSATLAGTVPTVGGPVDFLMTNASGTNSASYITTGIHTEFGRNRTIRVAGVFPTGNRSARRFDAELVVQLGSRY